MNRFKTGTVVLLIAAAITSTSLVRAQDRSSRQRITGTTMGIGGRSSGRTMPFTLIINRYTSQAEVEEINDARRRGEGGQQER